jgi:hypothetical protein
VAAYTADKSHAERADVQAAFEQGRVSVLIATTAFGLGINKKDIRWVRNTISQVLGLNKNRNLSRLGICCARECTAAITANLVRLY